MTEAPKRPPTVVVWGELLWDLHPTERHLGGCAANVAHHLAQLGRRPILVTRIGRDDLGTAAIEELIARQIDVRAVQRDPTQPTGSVAVRLINREPRFAMVAEAAWDRIEWNAQLAQLVADAHLLYYGTFAQRTALGAGALAHAWRAASPNCVRVCDLNIRTPNPLLDIVEASLRAAQVVKLNEHEAAFVRAAFGCPDPATWLIDACGARLVALTRGERGCVLQTRDFRVTHPGFPQGAVRGDPVGAGDAFTAVLCAHLSSGAQLATRSDLEQLAERANHVASYVASCPGATPSLPDSVLRASRPASS